MRYLPLPVVLPILAIGLCGAAAAAHAQDDATSARQLFSREPTGLREALRVQTVSVEVPEATGAEASKADHSLVVTSDSRDYCRRLVRAIEAHDDGQHRSVGTLREEGQTLCSEGHIRLGVSRLREALAILKGRNHP
ncbi:hypothetical protein [Acetobacter estunensis]|uniref:hypothetical protein n=1 Tax=Acetobacter estunensis TaxID=104097 RepID=UPI001C2D1320|nr:hypothetical protein [Acetobacter estunensis]MBV1836560.1 hypothetical protein [Acetobacter estunensis]